MKHCLRLADQLGLSDEFRKRLEKERLDGTAARTVLFKWKQEKSHQATGKMLFDALIAINKRDVAAAFAEQLLGEGERNVDIYISV